MMSKGPSTDYVLASDYDALATRCERLEAEMRAIREFILTSNVSPAGMCNSIANSIDAALSQRAGDNQ